ncbi:MAG: hypothetical protein LC789_18330 [Actinobacteria bacterium]|nr:hypothetical protein [Actinomycetota bacterium]
MAHRPARLVLLVLVLATGLASAAAADTGSLTDPAGDYPDIRRLSYNNAETRVVIAMKYAELDDVQNHSFYMKWADGYYQVFYSPGIEMTELRKNGVKKPCAGLTVTEYPDTERARAVVPRTCLPAAPNRLRFRGIATAGMYSSDQTAWSPLIARG